ncbi:recombinase family protein [Streptomyces albospinus]|uniref:recombinase family protein n=1 Tax=Streptomyces albospinus TaxID=285515 RepID=UPI001E5745D2|nr:recombinase family protein [Streptomyces albospinus]
MTGSVGDCLGEVFVARFAAFGARRTLDTLLDSLGEAGVVRIFWEKSSPRATKPPELEKAVGMCRELRASGVGVTLVVHEHKRLGRGIDLAMLAEELKASDVGLEFLTGELQGAHDPSVVVLTVPAATSGKERAYSATAPSKAMKPPVPAARPSATRASPTTPWRSHLSRRGSATPPGPMAAPLPVARWSVGLLRSHGRDRPMVMTVPRHRKQTGGSRCRLPVTWPSGGARCR